MKFRPTQKNVEEIIDMAFEAGRMKAEADMAEKLQAAYERGFAAGLAYVNHPYRPMFPRSCAA